MAVVTFNSAGSGVWLCPSGVTSVKVECWGGGGSGQHGTGPAGGTGGGGGEYAAEAALAVTPGKQYSWTVGPGGTGSPGSLSSFTGDTLTVTAHGGTGGGSGGTGGTGSSNATHFNGGNGGAGSALGPGLGGGGGGSSAGSASVGGNGVAGNSVGGGPGGTPPAGGAAGGAGGGGLHGGAPGSGGFGPGGAGGGGGSGSSGGSGAAGQVQLTYTGAFQPQVPYFPAGFAPLHSDFDNWIQSPLAFLTPKIVFRAELTSALALPNNTATVIPFNSILEDPFSGWQAGSSQWLCPGGQSGIYEVRLTVSCAANASRPVVSARVGVDTSTFVYSVDKAWVPNVTVPGMASGAIPVQLYGGQDSVQGIGFVVGAAGSVVTTAGQRCRMSISWQSL